MAEIKKFLLTCEPEQAEWRNWTILRKKDNRYKSFNPISTFELCGKITRGFIRDKKTASNVQDIVYEEIIKYPEIYGKKSTNWVSFSELEFDAFCSLLRNVCIEG